MRGGAAARLQIRKRRFYKFANTLTRGSRGAPQLIDYRL